MKLDIITRNCEINERLKELTNAKFSKLDKYFGADGAWCKVCFKREGALSTTEVMLDYASKFVRATASCENFYDTLDIVLPKLEGQIRKYRTRFDKHSKNNAYKDASIFDVGENYENKKSKLVKEKKFVLKPMTLNEAIEEMDVLGHSFYIFKEVKTNTVQVLYKRNDGDLALIETE